MSKIASNFACFGPFGGL